MRADNSVYPDGPVQLCSGSVGRLSAASGDQVPLTSVTHRR